MKIRAFLLISMLFATIATNPAIANGYYTLGKGATVLRITYFSRNLLQLKNQEIVRKAVAALPGGKHFGVNTIIQNGGVCVDEFAVQGLSPFKIKMGPKMVVDIIDSKGHTKTIGGGNKLVQEQIGD